ncbi:MAG: hypothetical protein IT350_03120 [Deltaproteobacteria bacterium]|nr:hypothetical protein [Deltaproteobacteria bacterium]
MLSSPLAWRFVAFVAVAGAVNALIVRESWNARRAAFRLALWLLVALAFEALVRLAMPHAGRAVWPGYPAGLVVTDPVLGHAYQPGFSAAFPQQRYLHIPIRINAAGFRDAEWPSAPDDTLPRVATLGDSITFGSPIAAEQRYTDVLASLLAESGRPARVMNAGVNGYNVEQYRTLLEARGDGWRPRVVLVGLCQNDAEPLAPVDAETIDAAAGRASLAARLRPYRLDVGQSYAYNVSRRIALGRLYASPTWGPKLIARYDHKTQESLATLYTTGDGRERLRREMGAMRDLARARWNAELAVVVFPYHSQITSGRRELCDAASAVLTELDIPHRNLFADFAAAANEPDLYVTNDDCHPSALGHRITAKAAAELVEPLLP